MEVYMLIQYENSERENEPMLFWPEQFPKNFIMTDDAEELYAKHNVLGTLTCSHDIALVCIPDSEYVLWKLTGEKPEVL